MEFKKLNQNEYTVFLQASLDRYLDSRTDLNKADLNAFRIKTENELKQLLPEGLATEGQHFYKALNNQQKAVGIIWVGAHAKHPADTAWGWDFFVYPEFQNGLMGYRMLQEGAILLKSLGYKKLHSCVHKDNKRAVRLYEKLGFKVIADFDAQYELCLELAS